VALDRLSDWGFEIRPYYLYREGLFGNEAKDFGSRFADYQTVFLTLEDMALIAGIDGRTQVETILRERLERGQKCLAIKDQGQIAAFTWINLKESDYKPCRFLLQSNEAYLYDAHTVKAFRGKGLAPYLRLRCYEALEKMGRETFYSFSDAFNFPAIKFKKKLNARSLKLGLYILLFKRYFWSWTLKKME
jgi:hypothetical protein